MFLEKYVDFNYLELIYSNYDERYLNMLDETNFKSIYDLLVKEKFYFISDVILNYLELFEIDVEHVRKALYEVKKIIGDDYNNVIGQNMNIIDTIINLANNYSNADD